MFSYSKDNLSAISALLRRLPDGIYMQPGTMLSDATIGQHVRHIVELYQCLLNGYETGIVAYDRRKRDRAIETDMTTATDAINEIIRYLERPNIPLQVMWELNGEEFSIQSNYEREVIYNLEHAIHHMALIKVAVIELTDLDLPQGFGVAPATLQYRAECVQ